MLNRVAPLAVVLCLVGASWPARSVAQVTAPPAASALDERERLTGTWGGAREAAASHGVTFGLEFTSFGQDLLAGDGADQAAGGARLDALINLDTAKLGLWTGGALRTHAEARVGGIPTFRGGAIWPMNTGQALPLGGDERLVLSSLYYVQRVGAASTLMVGKINAVDLLAGDAFFGGWGTHRFLNVAFVAPPSGVTPPVLAGVVFSTRRGAWSFTGMAYDPNDQSNEYWVDDLFADGVNLSAGPSWSGTVEGRATTIGVNATLSTARGVDLSEILLAPDLKTGDRRGSFNVALQVSHMLLGSPVQKGKGLGVYAKAAVADGNPNPIGSSLVGGIAAHGLFASRPWDSFGVGYFYYDFSDDLSAALTPALALGNEQGLEIFYTAALAPWLRVGADLQVVSPAREAFGTAVVGTLRLNVVF